MINAVTWTRSGRLQYHLLGHSCNHLSILAHWARLLLLCDNFSLKTPCPLAPIRGNPFHWKWLYGVIPSSVPHSSLLFSPGDFQSLCKLVAIKGNVKGRVRVQISLPGAAMTQFLSSGDFVL